MLISCTDTQVVVNPSLDGMSRQDLATRNALAQRHSGEAFDRNLGAGSRLKTERGINRLWREGGLQYAPPIR